MGSHCHDHECAVCSLSEGRHEREDESLRREITEISFALAIFISGFLIDRVASPLFLAAYLISGYRIIYGALRDVINRKAFGENLLMTVASGGAIGIGEIPEAAAVMIFYRLGEFLEELAASRSRRSIKSILDVRPDRATVILPDGSTQERPAEGVDVGETILVKPGDRIPLDGHVTEGVSALDQSPITGESVPVPVESGSTVYSGSVNLKGTLKIAVDRPFNESTVSRILRLVEEAGERKADVEKFISRFARYYTPAVVAAAGATAVLPPLLGFGGFSLWFYRALIFLVISCPCALVISIPLGVFGGIGGAARKGILVKGGNYLEALGRVDAVVFDKTGTLTMGVFELQKINSFNHFSDDDTLEYAALAETHSDHPVAHAIKRARSNDSVRIDEYEEIAGKGVRAVASGETYHAGNDKLLGDLGIAHTCEEIGTVVHIVKNGVLVGEIVVSDKVKSDVRHTVSDLRKMGIKGIYMLTGDRREIAEEIGDEFDFDEVHAELLPEEKVERFDEIKRRHKLVAFVGDGINDAPVIASADVGVAMGGIGRDAAIEVADVVIATDEPSKLADAMRVARKTRRIVWQNIIFALGIKAAFLSLGFAGAATMWEAIFADVGVALLAVANSLRATFRT